jgi:hypothetical protein
MKNGKSAFVIFGLLLMTSSAFADVTYDCKKWRYEGNAVEEVIVINSSAPIADSSSVGFSSKDGSYEISHNFETGKLRITLHIVSEGKEYRSSASCDGDSGVELTIDALKDTTTVSCKLAVKIGFSG